MGSTQTKKQKLVELELNPASAVDVLGTPPVLWSGVRREFTEAEARDLLSLTNDHGAPIVRKVEA